MTGYACLYGYSPAPGVEFRCRRCLPCRTARRASWYGRLLLESREAADVGAFVTLTYKDDPGSLSSRYVEMQQFLKRLRHVKKFRYFAIADYGDRFGRGHWHLLIFGVPAGLLAPNIEKKWPHGFVDVGYLTPASIGYCSRYVLHFETDDDKTYSRQSCGIGFAGIRRLAEATALSGVELHYWPTRFRAGSGSYPLIDGARACFQKAFLAAGGSPPLLSDPDRLRASAEVLYRSDPSAYYEIVAARNTSFEGSRLTRKDGAKAHLDHLKETQYGLPPSKK